MMLEIEEMELAIHCLEKAMDILKRGESLVPVLICTDKSGMKVIKLDMADEEDKVKLETAIPAIIDKLGANAAIMITDGWRKDFTNTHRIGEILLLTIATTEGLSGITVKYTRDAQNKPVFEKPEFFTEMESRFFAGAFKGKVGRT